MCGSLANPMCNQGVPSKGSASPSPTNSLHHSTLPPRFRRSALPPTLRAPSPPPGPLTHTPLPCYHRYLLGTHATRSPAGSSIRASPDAGQDPQSPHNPAPPEHVTQTTELRPPRERPSGPPLPQAGPPRTAAASRGGKGRRRRGPRQGATASWSPCSRACSCAAGGRVWGLWGLCG